MNDVPNDALKADILNILRRRAAHDITAILLDEPVPMILITAFGMTIVFTVGINLFGAAVSIWTISLIILSLRQYAGRSTRILHRELTNLLFTEKPLSDNAWALLMKTSSEGCHNDRERTVAAANELLVELKEKMESGKEALKCSS